MDSRTLILNADRIAREHGMSQSQWSTVAGYAINGQTVSRIINNGDCRVSTFLNLLHAIGCELVIKEGQHE
jgi:hypothetical protein